VEPHLSLLKSTKNSRWPAQRRRKKKKKEREFSSRSLPTTSLNGEKKGEKLRPLTSSHLERGGKTKLERCFGKGGGKGEIFLLILFYPLEKDLPLV